MRNSLFFAVKNHPQNLCAMPKERRSPPVDEVFSQLERQRNVALAQAAQARKNSPTFLGERMSQ